MNKRIVYILTFALLHLMFGVSMASNRDSISVEEGISRFNSLIAQNKWNDQHGLSHLNSHIFFLSQQAENDYNQMYEKGTSFIDKTVLEDIDKELVTLAGTGVHLYIGLNGSFLSIGELDADKNESVNYGEINAFYGEKKDQIDNAVKDIYRLSNVVSVGSRKTALMTITPVQRVLLDTKNADHSGDKLYFTYFRNFIKGDYYNELQQAVNRVRETDGQRKKYSQDLSIALKYDKEVYVKAMTEYDDLIDGQLVSATLTEPFWFGINEQEVYYYSNLRNNSTNLLNDKGEFTYLTPAGKPFTLPEGARLSFTGKVVSEGGLTYDLKVTRGALLAFEDNTGTYTAAFTIRGSSYQFLGYRLVGGTELDLKKIDAPTSSNGLVLTGVKDSHCQIEIISGNYQFSGSGNSSEYKGDGPVISSPSFSLVDTEYYCFKKIPNGQGCVDDRRIADFDISYVDFLKKATILIDPNDKYGVMFAYEFDGAVGYVYQRLDDQGNEEYFKWNNVIWERLNLNRNEILNRNPHLLTLLDVWRIFTEDPVHLALDIVGFIPVIGVAADGLNTVLYTIEGKYTDAALSGIAIIGGSVLVLGKYAINTAKNARRVIKLGEKLDPTTIDRINDVVRKVEKTYLESSGGLSKFQSNLYTLVDNHGPDVLKNLDNVLDNAKAEDFLTVVNKISGTGDDAIDQLKFLEDLGDVSFAKAIGENPELIGTWRNLDNAGVNVKLRKKPGVLERARSFECR